MGHSRSNKLSYEEIIKIANEGDNKSKIASDSFASIVEEMLNNSNKSDEIQGNTKDKTEKK
jgi:hypothetical protein